MIKNNWKHCLVLTGLFLIMVSSMAGCSGHKILVRPFAPENIFHVSELKDWKDVANLNNCVFYLNKGDSVPLRLSMDTDFMEFKQDRIDLVAKEKLYFMIKIPENLSADELAHLKKLNARSFSKMSARQRAAFLKDYMLFVSKDAQHWAPLYGSKAYRQILGFKKGLLSFGIMASATDGLGASLDIRTVK